MLNKVCSLSPFSEDVLSTTRRLSILLDRLGREIRDCPQCEGMYCPELIELNARIEAAIAEINQRWGMPE